MAVLFNELHERGSRSMLRSGYSRDESEPSKVGLERSNVGQRGARDALGLERLHEANVRDKNGHPGEGSKDSDEGDKVGEDLLGSARNGKEAAESVERCQPKLGKGKSKSCLRAGEFQLAQDGQSRMLLTRGSRKRSKGRERRRGLPCRWCA